MFVIYIQDRGNGSPVLRLVGEAPAKTRTAHHPRACVRIYAAIIELWNLCIPCTLLGICFVVEGPIRRNTFGRLVQSRSYQSKRFGVHFQMHRLKDEMTNRPVITCIMIVNLCKGHECNFSQAVSCAYKQMNSTPVLFTLSCIRSGTTLGFLPSIKPKV